MDYTKKLHNTIFISDRIITYKAAAAILNLDVNETKTVLKAFVERVKQKNESIGVTCVVGGTINNAHKLVVVPESKYANTKSMFDNVTIDHIYSLQKSEVIDWAAVFSVDDFICEDKTVEIKKEIKTDVVEEVVKPKELNKKGSINGYFSQNQTVKAKTEQCKTIKQEIDLNKSEKKSNSTNTSAKSSFMSNYMNKANNKENVSKKSNESKKIVTNAVKSDEENDEDFVVKKSKKRARVINDDDDFPESKSPKIDILDEEEDDVIEGSENGDDTAEDIWGSPEKDDKLINGSETMKSKSKESQEDVQSTAPTETSSQTETDASEKMYEDDEGFYVTKKTPVAKKRKLDKVPDKSKDAKPQEKKVEIQAKKEVAQKLKKDNNQKTLFNFFKKM